MSSNGGGEGSRKRTLPEDELVTFGEVYQDMISSSLDGLLAMNSNDKCTYDGGVKDRQMVYSCLTCGPTDGNRVGVCLACSIHCHREHILVRLYTKRLFQCDCGTKEMKTCTLAKDTETKRTACITNNYARNYDGLYCVCNKPYSDDDEEDDTEGDVTQDCVEDEVVQEKKGELAENQVENQEEQKENAEKPSEEQKENEGETNEDADVMLQCNHCEDWFHTKCLTKGAPFSAALIDSIVELTCPSCVTKIPLLTKLHSMVSVESDKPVCLASCQDKEAATPFKMLLWLCAFREKLCKCDECKELYAAQSISYLLSPGDVAKEKSPDELEEDCIAQMSQNMDPSAVRIVASEMNIMKEELIDFIKKSDKDGKTITKEEIHAFFEKLTENKNKRLRPDNAPHTA